MSFNKENFVRYIQTAMVAVALVGFFDASFLALEHFRGVIPPCQILSGCGTVTTSVYAVVFGIPVALIGAIYYLSIGALLLYCIDRKNERLFQTTARLTVLGFLASLYFLFLQVFVLNALCLYCMISAATSTLLFAGGTWILSVRNKQQPIL